MKPIVATHTDILRVLQNRTKPTAFCCSPSMLETRIRLNVSFTSSMFPSPTAKTIPVKGLVSDTHTLSMSRAQYLKATPNKSNRQRYIPEGRLNHYPLKRACIKVPHRNIAHFRID
jgi:hypothetical protein